MESIDERKIRTEKIINSDSTRPTGGTSGGKFEQHGVHPKYDDEHDPITGNCRLCVRGRNRFVGRPLGRSNEGSTLCADSNDDNNFERRNN